MFTTRVLVSFQDQFIHHACIPLLSIACDPHWVGLGLGPGTTAGVQLHYFAREMLKFVLVWGRDAVGNSKLDSLDGNAKRVVDLRGKCQLDSMVISDCGPLTHQYHPHWYTN